MYYLYLDAINKRFFASDKVMDKNTFVCLFDSFEMAHYRAKTLNQELGLKS